MAAKRKPVKPLNAWAVVTKTGVIIAASIRVSRNVVIPEFLFGMAGPRSNKWDYWHKQGCRVKRVTIVAAKTKGPTRDRGDEQ